jgi:hypothetical protein
MQNFGPDQNSGMNQNSDQNSGMRRTTGAGTAS